MIHNKGMAERELPNEIPADHSYMQDGDTQIRVLHYEEAGVYATENLSTGEISYLGESQNPQAVEALFEMRNAQGADLEKIQTDLERLNENPELGHNLIEHRDHRQTKVEAYSKEVNQKSFNSSDRLPDIDPQELHRQDRVDYSTANWKEINEVMNDYQRSGGDPTDIGSVRRHLEESGLSAEDQKWGESLVEDPIKVEGGIFVNGRHRTHEMQNQGVVDIFFQDYDRIKADPDYEKKIMSGKEAKPVTVDHLKNIKGVVYENENELHRALSKEYGSTNPAQDLNTSQDNKYRLSVVELDDGTVVGYGYDLKTGRTTVRGEYGSMKEAEQYSRGTYADEVRDAFSKHDKEQSDIRQAEHKAAWEAGQPQRDAELEKRHTELEAQYGPPTKIDDAMSPDLGPTEFDHGAGIPSERGSRSEVPHADGYLLDDLAPESPYAEEWAPDKELTYEEKMEQVDRKVRVTMPKQYKAQQDREQEQKKQPWKRNWKDDITTGRGPFQI